MGLSLARPIRPVLRRLGEVATFHKSPAWKAYKKQQLLHQKRTNITLAKSKFLADAPKKPPAAYRIFANEQRADIMKQHPQLKGAIELSTKTSEIWKDLRDACRGRGRGIRGGPALKRILVRSTGGGGANSSCNLRGVAHRCGRTRPLRARVGAEIGSRVRPGPQRAKRVRYDRRRHICWSTPP